MPANQCMLVDTKQQKHLVLNRRFNKENRLGGMERNHAQRRTHLAPTGIQGKSAVLLPRQRQEFSRLSGTSSRASKASSIPSPRDDNKQRKLVLHFDARNTVLVADTVTQIGVKEAFNSYLTGVMWGYEKDNGDWQWVRDTPSLTSPASGAITYYKHRERELVRTPSDRGELRRVTGSFTQEPLGERFLPYLERGLASIRWTHAEHVDQLIMVDKDGEKYHYLLPSVFQVIQHLQDTKRDFSIVIRTYGSDAPNILKTIAASLEGKHPDFPRLTKMPVDHHIGTIKRHADGKITLQTELDGNAQTLTNERQIYNFLSSCKGVTAIVDDFIYWQKNDYDHTCSKPHWVDTSDRHTQHIIFDDNLRVTDRDSIVDLRRFQGNQQRASSVLDLDLMQRYENACLVQADLLESTANLNYFVDKIKLCERRYDELLNSPAS